LEFLEIEDAYLVGCSQGAKTIIDFALEHPQMARALVVVSPALSGFAFAGELPRQAAQLDAADEAGDIDQVNELELQIWVDGPHRSPDEVDAKVRQLVREMNQRALKTPEDLGDEQPLEPPAANRLGGIRAPTLVICGDLVTPMTVGGGRLHSAPHCWRTQSSHDGNGSHAEHGAARGVQSARSLILG
jgi:pimeloyl-ACP methyl ester carboxylesterase